MRITFFLIGMIMMMPAASAQNLANAPDPLSPFVKQAIEKTQKIYNDYIPTLSASEMCEEQESNVLSQAMPTLRKTYDAVIALSAESERLSSETVCQTYDLKILEAEMIKIRALMVDTAQGCELSTVLALGDMHEILSRAYESVLMGGLDPMYIDFTQRQSMYFIDGQPIDENVEASACPFTTDYAPASVAEVGRNGGTEIVSMGCDADTVDIVVGLPEEIAGRAFLDEVRQLQSVMDDVKGIADTIGVQVMDFYRAFDRILGTIRNRGNAPLGTIDPPVNTDTSHDHYTIAGCQQEIIKNENDEQIVFQAQTWERDQLPEGLLLTPANTYFGVYKDSMNVLLRFFRQSAKDGERRPIVFDASTDSIVADFMSGQAMKEYFSVQARELEKLRASAIARHADSVQRIIDAAKPLRSAVYSFGQITSFPVEENAGEPPDVSGVSDAEKDDYRYKAIPLLPQYIRDLAFFMRRSCVYGQCSCQLNAVIFRAMQPECFPYGSQKFRDPKYIEKCYDHEALTRFDQSQGISCNREPVSIEN